MTAHGTPQFTGAGTSDFTHGPFAVSDGAALWRCGLCGTQNHIQLDHCAACGNGFSTSLQLGASVGQGIIGLSAPGARGMDGFFERISKGFRLIGYSWQALRMDPELMVITFLAGLLITAFGFVIFQVMGGLQMSQVGTPAELQIPLPLIASYYFVAYLIGVFCQGAIVSAALTRFTGGNPTIGGGLAAAARKIVPLAGWALIGSTVAMILRALEERFRWMARMFEVAWSVVTYFVIPVIMMENVGPGGAFRRSKTLLRQRWAETLVASFGIGVAMFIVMLSLVAVTIALATISPLAGVIFAIASFTVTIVIGSTLSAICNAALYFYAVSGTAPVPFPSGVLRNAFPGAHPNPGLASS